MSNNIRTNKIDSRGRITIPQEFREALTDLKEGTAVKFKVDNGKLILWMDDGSFLSLNFEYLFNRLLELEVRLNNIDIRFNDFERGLMKEIFNMSKRLEKIDDGCKFCLHKEVIK